MDIGHGWRNAHRAAGLISYLREPLEPDEALEEVRSRVDRQAPNFLRLAEASIFEDPRSPHLKLLGWAGWDYARLRRSVEDQGLSATLATLRDLEVRTSLDELKGRKPLRRGPLTIATGDSAFDNHRIGRRGLGARTSGTSSRSPIRVPYHWGLFSEEAALECLLFESHGLSDAPCALWLPCLPSISGIHNLLVQMRFRRPPERWFSQLPPRRRDALIMRYVQSAGRGFGMRIPLPEATPFADAEHVAGWMHSARRRAGTAVLKTFATSAVRVAESALRQELELDGCVFLVGGEPLTERRRTFIASTGATVFGRYVATETGWVAGACPRSDSPDVMHLYTDRLVVVPGEPKNDGNALLFTTISPQAGMVLLNTDIGDAGHLRTRPCSCALGRAGLDVEVSGVYGHDKLTGDGTTVPRSVLGAVLDRLIDAAGGAPDSYQLREEEDESGAARLVILLSPDVHLDEVGLVSSLLEGLPAHGFGAELAAMFWKAGETIEVRRERPEISSSAKLPAFVARSQ